MKMLASWSASRVGGTPFSARRDAMSLKTFPLGWHDFSNVAKRFVMRPWQAILIGMAVCGLPAPGHAWGAGSEGPRHFFLLDMRGDMFELSGTNRNTGTRWTKVAPDDAFLAADATALHGAGIDVSGTGQARVDGLTLVSNRLRVAVDGSPKEVVNAWDLLTVLDTNRDGKLDSRDPCWSHLRIFVDRNGDGAIAESEVRTVAEAGIRDLAARTAAPKDGRVDPHGNTLVEGAFTRGDGSTERSADVTFARVSNGEGRVAQR
jgi:hypothetical protein